MTEELQRVTQAALKWLEERVPAETLNTQTYAQNQFPKEDPQWDLNDDKGLQQILKCYQEALRGSLKGEKKAMNMSKTSEALQGTEESPSQCYERLCEAFCLYTLFDPEAAENQTMVNAAFVSRA